MHYALNNNLENILEVKFTTSTTITAPTFTNPIAEYMVVLEFDSLRFNLDMGISTVLSGYTSTLGIGLPFPCLYYAGNTL